MAALERVSSYLSYSTLLQEQLINQLIKMALSFKMKLLSPFSELPPSFTPIRKQLTRDLRLQVRTLHDVGFQYARIASSLDILTSQVQYAMNHRLTPQNKLSGPAFMLDDNAAKILIDFDACSSSNALLSYRLRAQLKRLRARYTTSPRITWLSQACGSKKTLSIGA